MTTEKRFAVTTVHGEGRSLYHVVDTLAPESEQPKIIVTYRDHESAYRHAEGLNIADGGKRAMVLALAAVFGAEWTALGPGDKILILRDCTEEGGVSDLAEYRRNIGSGNLQRYVLTQRVRFARKA